MIEAPTTTLLLQVEGLTVTHNTAKKDAGVQLVRKVSFALDKGQSLGIVGASGSGKTLLCMSLLGVLPAQMHVSGQATFDGQALIGRGEKGWGHIRGRGISLIPQDASTAYAPFFTLGRQILPCLRQQLAIGAKEARELACESLASLRMPDPEATLDKYPHQLSGGMLQRCMIATALALGPRVIIADEPATALDVLAQQDVIDELQKVREQTGAALVFISHDLALVRAMAGTILVMRSGEAVEYGPADAILHSPRHTYTQYLLRARRSMNGGCKASNKAADRANRREPPEEVAYA